MFILFPVTTVSKLELKQKVNKSVCQCGHDAFIFGGIIEYGIKTIMCCNYSTEYNVKALDIQLNIYTNKAPLYNKMPTKGRLYLRQDNTFKTGPIVSINNRLFYFLVDKLLDCSGQDFCMIIENELYFIE